MAELFWLRHFLINDIELLQVASLLAIPAQALRVQYVCAKFSKAFWSCVRKAAETHTVCCGIPNPCSDNDNHLITAL